MLKKHPLDEQVHGKRSWPPLASLPAPAPAPAQALRGMGEAGEGPLASWAARRRLWLLIRHTLLLPAPVTSLTRLCAWVQANHPSSAKAPLRKHGIDHRQEEARGGAGHGDVGVRSLEKQTNDDVCSSSTDRCLGGGDPHGSLQPLARALSALSKKRGVCRQFRSLVEPLDLAALETLHQREEKGSSPEARPNGQQ